MIDISAKDKHRAKVIFENLVGLFPEYTWASKTGAALLIQRAYREGVINAEEQGLLIMVYLKNKTRRV